MIEEDAMMNLDSDNQIAVAKFREMIIQIQDLFQRYGHALDRIISLEEKVRCLQGSVKTEVD